jgi:hypothetical protein
MHKLIRAVALFAFTGALFAQNPFAGTWKLDTAKTKYTTGEPPKDLTLAIEEQGDNIQVSGTGTNADGSPLSVKYSVPLNGGAGQVQEGPYDAVSSKRISANVRENSYNKNGKEVASRHVVVSKDGKTMKSTVKGINAMGNAIKGIDVFEKQ